jgi:hypothetical protein
VEQLEAALRDLEPDPEVLDILTSNYSQPLTRMQVHTINPIKGANNICNYNWRHSYQGCQMVYFQTSFGTFWKPFK